MVGPSIRHGPHHGAQKSTSTGTVLSMTSFCQFSVVSSMTLALAMFVPLVIDCLAIFRIIRKSSRSGQHSSPAPFLQSDDFSMPPDRARLHPSCRLRLSRLLLSRKRQEGVLH